MIIVINNEISVFAHRNILAVESWRYISVRASSMEAILIVGYGDGIPGRAKKH